jgi:hypothetical protein
LTQVLDTNRIPGSPRGAVLRASAAGGAVLATLLLAGGAGAGWVTNSVALDPGTCGRNLQVGSNPTAAGTATPTFMLQGDGGLSSYTVSIDRRRLGTFRSAGGGVVCIRTRRPLAEGPHLLAATELAPNAGRLVRLRFSVDTVPPKPPSRPMLAAPAGSQTLTISGAAAPNQAVQLLADGRIGIAGAVSDSSGRWTASAVGLPAGTYAITAFALDSAGNRSRPSEPTRVTLP